MEKFFLTIRHLSLDSEAAISKLLILILLILVASFFIDYLLSHSILGGSYRIFVAPGIIIHELSHAAGCLLTGAKMTRISFFEKDGGSVEHRASKLPILGSLIISLAPFVAGSVAIYFLSRRLGVQGINLSALDISRDGLMSYFKSAISNLDLHQVKTWLIIYLVLTIAVTMTPSFQDLKNTAGSAILIGAAIFLFLRFTSYNLYLINIPNPILTLLSTVVLLLILALVLSILIFLISKLFKPI